MLGLLTLLAVLVLQFLFSMYLAYEAVFTLGHYHIQITTVIQYLIVGYSSVMSTVLAILVIYSVLGIMSEITERKKKRSQVSRRED